MITCLQVLILYYSVIILLLQKCSSPTTNAIKEWEEYVQICSLIEKICRKVCLLSLMEKEMTISLN